MKIMWTFEEALNTIQHLEQTLHPHYHVALAGGVLHHGDSKHDLDLIVFPHSSPHFEIEEVHALLMRMGLTLKVPREVIVKAWRKKGSNDNKYVEVWIDEASRRLDILYWKDFS
jgi:hypothetical protein